MLNEMMHRPVVMQKIIDLMREGQLPFEGVVGQLEAFANANGIPVVPHETAKFLDFFCATTQPQQILEIGTAIGFSASLMAQHLASDGHLTTIDRYALMFERAKSNFEQAGLADKVTVLEGDAADILPTLPANHYDLIFMDSAKAKYLEFYPYCIRLLKMGGVLLIDDVLQAGTIMDALDTRPKRVRKIHRKLNELFQAVLTDQDQRACLLPLGDGLLMVRKEKEIGIEDFLATQWDKTWCQQVAAKAEIKRQAAAPALNEFQQMAAEQIEDSKESGQELAQDICLIAIDLDGTLLTNQKTISATNVATLARAHEAGIKIVICTGRTLPGVDFYVPELPFLSESDFMILQNGAQTLSAQAPFQSVFQRFLTQAARQRALELVAPLKDQGAQLVAFDRDHLYLVGDPTPNALVARDAQFLKTDVTPISDEDFLANSQLNKAMILAPETVLDAWIPTIEAADWQALSMVRSQKVILEFLPVGVSKASGLDQLARHLGLRPEQVMALGDAANDAEMLDFAGCAVAMGNASDDLKAKADFVTLTNEEDGVSHAIETLILQKKQNHIE